MKKSKVYQLQIEDLSGLGGPMGTERTSSSYRHFDSVEKAKAAAKKNYNGSRGPIEWKESKNSITSGDLGYVMYTITPTKVE